MSHNIILEKTGPVDLSVAQVPGFRTPLIPPKSKTDIFGAMLARQPITPVLLQVSLLLTLA